MNRSGFSPNLDLENFITFNVLSKMITVLSNRRRNIFVLGGFMNVFDASNYNHIRFFVFRNVVIKTNVNVETTPNMMITQEGFPPWVPDFPIKRGKKIGKSQWDTLYSIKKKKYEHTYGSKWDAAVTKTKKTRRRNNRAHINCNKLMCWFFILSNQNK